MAGAVALSTRGLVVRRGEREIVRGVDFELARGEIVALLGPNGAGKSTLVAALAGLVEPAGGSVHRDGRVAAALQAPALARRSALANVEAALAWWGVPRDAHRERAAAALEQVGLGHLAAQPAATLSGGEARRVHIARLLALDADVLLLDEPFAGLDAPTRADLLYDAASVLRRRDRSVLVVLHDRAEAWALADRILVLLDGRIAADGRPADVLDHPPSRPVAEFLGFTGQLREAGGVRLLRPAHVTLTPEGELSARVTRRIPLEDGLRLELETDAGRLVALATLPGPDVGEVVRVHVHGGVHFAE
jgi:ABC-type nitrate/sulfonate/bicarbonate transport system ATPase subunit